MKIYANVVATVECMIEMDDQENPTCKSLEDLLSPKDVEKALSTNLWKHVSNLRVMHWVKE